MGYFPYWPWQWRCWFCWWYYEEDSLEMCLCHHPPPPFQIQGSFLSLCTRPLPTSITSTSLLLALLPGKLSLMPCRRMQLAWLALTAYTVSTLEYGHIKASSFCQQPSVDHCLLTYSPACAQCREQESWYCWVLSALYLASGTLSTGSLPRSQQGCPTSWGWSQPVGVFLPKANKTHNEHL